MSPSSTPVARLVTIRVVAIEDDSRYRASLEALLEHSPGFTLAGSFASPVAALAFVEESPPPPWDLVLMDLELPGISGIEATRRLKAVLPGVPVVVLTVFEEPRTVLEAICAGADGYLAKRTPPEHLLGELRAVVQGGAPLSSGVAQTVLSLLRHLGPKKRPSLGGAKRSPTRLDLTEREQQVLRCLVQGMVYKQVAHELGITLDTVRTHVRNVYSKLQVHSVAEAVGRAIREGLV